ncbi:MAG: hypothetical protein Alpg2KO_02130 [Alphaproteobacteria bacterium]
MSGTADAIPRGGIAPLNRLADAIDFIMRWIGATTAWATLGCVLVVLTVVILRYVFQLSSTEVFGVEITLVRLQEVYLWWFHDVVLMIGAAFTLLVGGHVRVDIIYSRKSWRYRAWVDALGTLFLLWPMMASVAWFSWDYVAKSWASQEQSFQAGGLPGLYLVKGLIIAFCVLMAIQGLSLLCRSASYLLSPPDEPEPVEPKPEEPEAVKTDAAPQATGEAA